MDQNTIDRINEGLDILAEALIMTDAERLTNFGTESLTQVIRTIRRLVAEAQQ